MSHPYGLTEADKPALDRVARVVTIAARHAAEVDARGRFPEEALQALAAEGLLGLTVPAHLGGLGLGPRALAGCAEALAGACGSTAMIYVMHVAATQAIASSTTLGGKDSLLREIAAGRHLTTLAFSEQGSRSQFWAPMSRLEPQGDGFTTSAAKSWVTTASRASSYVSSAQAPQATSPLESTVYLARTGTQAVRPAGGFDGLGLRGNDSQPVTIEGLAVGAGDLISDVGAGAKTMLEVVLPWFCTGTAAMASGLARAAVEATAAHLQGASFAHTGQALRELPQLRARLAQMFGRAEAARALVGRALGEMEAGAAEAPLYVLAMRRVALETAVEVTDLAMRACGGAAFSRRGEAGRVERLFRDARAGWVMAPTVDHLDDFLGKALTGLPLF